MPAATLIISLTLGMQAPAPAAEPPSDTIVVTGERDKRNPLGGIEEPYPETERVPLGSRIARKVERRPFSSVASESGVTGMFVSKDSHFDGTGGNSPQFRMRRVKQCVAEEEQVSEEVACILYRVKQALDKGGHAAASTVLEPLLERRGLTRWERYYVGHYALRLAEALKDDARREAALAMMVASGRMPEADRPVALRALAVMALNSGDDQTAIARLEAAAQSAPGDVRSRANLAALYARYGREEQARIRMAEAVEIVRRSGQTPPAEWTAFLARAN